uniref:Sulfotransferase n=1 Tax=Alexandrium andersonii TaxID=327968 RepID=A0A7S2CEG4_9DINO
MNVVSEVTGCPMYFTPQKYWPKALAEKYIGGKTPFGLLRDPYERLVAFFRGNMTGYGGSYPEYIKTCDVNGAVKLMMKRLLEGGDPYAKGCTFIPQAEYFERPYGIQLPVNLRQFPASMNRVFSEHGYPASFQITISDVQHVLLCSQVWPGDLDEEARRMVRKVYWRDFELLCKYFGYCDPDENCCLWQVPTMCPDRVLALGYHGTALNISNRAR